MFMQNCVLLGSITQILENYCEQNRRTVTTDLLQENTHKQCYTIQQEIQNQHHVIPENY